MDLQVKNVTEGSCKGKVTLNSIQMAKGLAAFRDVTPLPQKNKTPEFSDEAATIYMQFSSNTISNGYLGCVNLPNPLSFNRSVCLYSDFKEEEDQSKMITLIKSIGVTGDIKAMPRSEIELLVAAEDSDAIAELATSYDSHITDPLSAGLTQMLTPALHAQRKAPGRCRMVGPQPKFLRSELRATPVFTVPGLGHVGKVGHTGMTAAQITENIEAVVAKFLKWNERFPRGLAHFESIELKTGLTDGVAIFVNRGEVVPEPLRELYRFGERKPMSETERRPSIKKKRNRKRKAAASVGKSPAAPAAKKTKGLYVRPLPNEETEPASKSPSLKKKKNKKGKGRDGATSATNGAASATESPAVKRKGVAVKAPATPAAKKQKAAAGVQLSAVGEKMKKKKKRQQSVAA